jgi:hypothetical protein
LVVTPYREFEQHFGCGKTVCNRCIFLPGFEAKQDWKYFQSLAANISVKLVPITFLKHLFGISNTNLQNGISNTNLQNGISNTSA